MARPKATVFPRPRLCRDQQIPTDGLRGQDRGLDGGRVIVVTLGEGAVEGWVCRRKCHDGKAAIIIVSRCRTPQVTDGESKDAYTV